jgi:addiction module HigA family antidote
VLRSFRDRDTEAIWNRQRSRLLDGTTQRVAWRKLAILDAAETLADLRVPPGNRLEKEGQMESDVAMPPVHPGEILLTEFLEPLQLSQYQLARSISVPARRINEIVHGDRRISADTALRLARFFGTSERFWMNLQSRYDLEIEKDRLGPTLDDIRPLSAASSRAAPRSVRNKADRQD